MKQKPGRVLFFAAAALVLSLSAAVDARQNQPQKVLRHDAAAVIKLVPVRVLDAAGRPVRGLRKEDFVLYDNNEQKLITEFETHESRGSRIAAEPAGAIERQVQPEANRKYFFVLDMQGSDMSGRRDAKKTVLEFVETQLQPGDEASVMTFGALTGLVLRQYLTSDLDKIKKAISRSIEMGGGGAGGGGITVSSGGAGGGAVAADQEQEIAERRSAGEQVSVIGGQNTQGSGRKISVASIVAADTPFGIRTGIQIEIPGLPPGTTRNKTDFDTSMAELAKAMKYTPGSKSVVYFSTRIPGKEVGKLFAEANAAIYAVNTNSVPSKGGGPGAGQRREMKEQQGEALRSFAEASGGHYFTDVKDAKTIAADVEALSGNYYVLGYYIKPSWDGRSHDIKVEVKQPGFKVLAQKGFNDPKPFAQLSDLEKKLQLFDLTLSDKPAATDALDLPVEILFGSAIAEVNAAVLMQLAVDERTGVPPEKAEIFTLVFDQSHKIVLAERGEIDLAPHAQKTLYPYFLASLPPGEYECRVAARGMETGQAAAARLSFVIPIPTAKVGTSLFSPLLLVPGHKPDFVRMSRPSKKEKGPTSIIQFYPFLPGNCSPLLGDMPPDAKKIWALLPLNDGTGQRSESNLDVRLVRVDDSREISIDWGVIDNKIMPSRIGYFLIGLGLPNLEPGAYHLEFSLTDVESGIKASVTSGIVKR